MADLDEDETSLVIRFVLPKNKSETTCSEDLSYAFDQAQDHDMNPSWIKDESCTSLTPDKTVGLKNGRTLLLGTSNFKIIPGPLFII